MSSSDIKSDDRDRRRKLPVLWLGRPIPLWVGFSLTAVWLGLLAAYLHLNWYSVTALEPNALGDFAAGAAAPLAFAWLVVAVLLQKDELIIQHDELMQSRKAQELLVEQTRASVMVAEQALDEQNRRAEEARIGRLIDTLAKRILLRSPSLRAEALDEDIHDLRIFGHTTPENDADEIFLSAVNALTEIARDWDKRYLPLWPHLLLDELDELLRCLSIILDGASKRSFPVLEARIEMLKLKYFRELLTDAKIWAGSSSTKLPNQNQ